MKIVSFNGNCTSPFFEYEDSNGGVNTIDYNPPIDDLDQGIQPSDYIVELLINPMLNNQSDIFKLCVKQANCTNADRQTVGAVFPVSALDGDQPVEKGICDFLYVAFWQLLERLETLACNDFSDNFESNVCVCVFSKKLSKLDNPLHLCIHSLRKYGYSYFESNNMISPVSGYKRNLIVQEKQKSINIEFKEPMLYSHPMVDRILRDLGTASNVTHRFVLLYQIIELLMEDAIVDDVDNIHNTLKSGGMSVNDYFENVGRISKEKARVKNIFTFCNITANECNLFKIACGTLLQIAGYNQFSTSEPDLFYNFRNQMTHSYRRLYAHKAELCETVQHFEKIVLLIVERYPRSLT